MRNYRSKIKSVSTLKRSLRGKRQIVFTNGCFDILHKGHIHYLERARRLGKVLVVALNTDASIKKLKGPKRPVNPLADRLDVLAALESVDFVTWFSESTPLKVIEELKPHILVKGGDWKASQIVGSDFVRDRGGRVRSLPFVKGRSTTSVIQKLGI